MEVDSDMWKFVVRVEKLTSLIDMKEAKLSRGTKKSLVLKL